MDYALKRILLLLHPFTPFLTEELWHGLGFGSETIQFAQWPRAKSLGAEPRAEKLSRAVVSARTLRATFNLASSKRLRWLLESSEEWVQSEIAVLSVLLNAESITLVGGRPAQAAACPTEVGILYLSLEGVVDPSTERRRLEAEMGKVQAEIDKVQRKLGSESFTLNAPSEVVSEHRQRLETWSARLEALRGARDALTA
jgi:valyl-tRNA synthetase